MRIQVYYCKNHPLVQKQKKILKHHSEVYIFGKMDKQITLCLKAKRQKKDCKTLIEFLQTKGTKRQHLLDLQKKEKSIKQLKFWKNLRKGGYNHLAMKHSTYFKQENRPIGVGEILRRAIAHVRVCIRGQEIMVFWKILRTYQVNDPY